MGSILYDKNLGITKNNIKGILEIKCPIKMYYPLINSNPYLPPHERLWITHFDQIQWSMGLLNVNWCDYLVYCCDNINLDTKIFDSLKIYIERIPFYRKYWEYVLLPKANQFLHKQILPYLRKIIPSPVIYF